MKLKDKNSGAAEHRISTGFRTEENATEGQRLEEKLSIEH
jgi:hypothetical protein